jgi:hypothetical protein
VNPSPWCLPSENDGASRDNVGRTLPPARAPR